MESELKKIGKINDKYVDRFYYYTEINIFMQGVENPARIKARVDTGSTRTIISLKDPALIPILESLRSKLELSNKSAESATGNNIELYEAIVDYLIITDEIGFRNIKISFTYDMDKKSVLGMDILTLYSFIYRKNTRLISFIDIERTANEIKKQQNLLNKEIECIDPQFIATINR